MARLMRVTARGCLPTQSGLTTIDVRWHTAGMTILFIIGVLLFAGMFMLAISAVVSPLVNWMNHWSNPTVADHPQFEPFADYVIPGDLQKQLYDMFDAACAVKGKPYRKLGPWAQAEIDTNRKHAIDAYLRKHNPDSDKWYLRQLRKHIFEQISLLDEYR